MQFIISLCKIATMLIKINLKGNLNTKLNNCFLPSERPRRRRRDDSFGILHRRNRRVGKYARSSQQDKVSFLISFVCFICLLQPSAVVLIVIGTYL